MHTKQYYTIRGTVYRVFRVVELKEKAIYKTKEIGLVVFDKDAENWPFSEKVTIAGV